MHVVIQVGQCGNQLGYHFFKALNETLGQEKLPSSFCEETKQRFFISSSSNQKLFARAVLVDTEEKVVNGLLSRENHSWTYHKKLCYVKSHGAANNWAMGYLEHSKEAHSSILELIRYAVEQCDYLSSFLVFMSVAGGTGSGLGTFISEVLKEEYPSVPVVNQVIWPFSRGEVTVQAYNSILTLSHLQNSSDALIIFENDLLYKLCETKLKATNFSLNELNLIASQQLANMYLFCRGSSYFTDILSHMVPHPQFKLLSLRSVPQESAECRPYSSYAWSSLLRSLRRMILYNNVIDEGVADGKASLVSLANMLFLRGPGANSADSELLHKPSFSYANGVPQTARLKVWTSLIPLFNQEKTGTLLNNGQYLTKCIDTAVSKAWKMYNYDAYLHHYCGYGLEKSEFITSFSQLEQLISSYKSLAST